MFLNNIQNAWGNYVAFLILNRLPVIFEIYSELKYLLL